MPSSAKHQRILIVDDMPTNIQALIEILQDHYILMVANEGKKALELATSQTPPDLILLDIVMPDMDGYETCRLLKADPKTQSIPIIFVTALNDNANEEEGLIAGAIDYITKPVVPALVKQRIKNHLDLYSYKTRLEKRVHEEIEKRMAGEDILIQQSKMAAMGEMLEAITHQWTQPLSALSILIQLIQHLYYDDDLDEEAFEKFIARADHNIQFMSETITSFGEFFKPNRRKRLTPLKNEFLQVAEFLAPQFEKYGITCEFDIPEEIYFSGHPNEFKQVILNLFNNAKDAFIKSMSNEKGAMVITSRVREEKEKILITICDNAGGIPPHIIKTLFKDRVFSTKEKGSGIGLFLCRIIIEDHHEGKIWATNSEQGACFSISLPKTPL